jgi:hypothetical protein
MAGTQLVLRPAGNSLAIEEIADPELRNHVHQLYGPFWAVWSGPFNMVTMSALIGLLLPLFLFLTWQTLMQGAWLMTLLSIGGLWMMWEAGSLVVSEISSIRKGKQEFVRLAHELPRASEAIQALKRVEPWRMWLLRRTLHT